MPIFEYSCRSCHDLFEVLMKGRQSHPVCPSCSSTDVDRLLSLPGIQSETTRGLAMRAATERDRRHAQDRIHERLRYEASHDRHG